jgi:hypothetical protein
VPPPQTLAGQQLVDPAPPHRDALLLVEVGLEPVERPGAEGQAQFLRVGQGRGDNGGTLLGPIGGRAARTGEVLERRQAPVIEAADPGRDGGPRDARLVGDLADSPAVGGPEEDRGPLDEVGGRGPGPGDPLQLGSLRRGQLTEGDSLRHWWFLRRIEIHPDVLANHLPDEPLRTGAGTLGVWTIRGGSR